MGKDLGVSVKITPKMKNALTKSLDAACVQPMKHILTITQTFDSDRHKIQAIQIYCKKTLEVINAMIKKELT